MERIEALGRLGCITGFVFPFLSQRRYFWLTERLTDPPRRYIMSKADSRGADIEAICCETDCMARRERFVRVAGEDFATSKENALCRKRRARPRAFVRSRFF